MEQVGMSWEMPWDIKDHVLTWACIFSACNLNFILVLILADWYVITLITILEYYRRVLRYPIVPTWCFFVLHNLQFPRHCLFCDNEQTTSNHFSHHSGEIRDPMTYIWTACIYIWLFWSFCAVYMCYLRFNGISYQLCSARLFFLTVLNGIWRLLNSIELPVPFACYWWHQLFEGICSCYNDTCTQHHLERLCTLSKKQAKWTRDSLALPLLASWYFLVRLCHWMICLTIYEYTRCLQEDSVYAWTVYNFDDNYQLIVIISNRSILWKVLQIKLCLPGTVRQKFSDICCIHPCWKNICWTRTYSIITSVYTLWSYTSEVLGHKTLYLFWAAISAYWSHCTFAILARIRKI